MANSPDPADDDDMVGMSLKIHQTSITRQDSWRGTLRRMVSRPMALQPDHTIGAQIGLTILLTFLAISLNIFNIFFLRIWLNRRSIIVRQFTMRLTYHLRTREMEQLIYNLTIQARWCHIRLYCTCMEWSSSILFSLYVSHHPAWRTSPSLRLSLWHTSHTNRSALIQCRHSHWCAQSPSSRYAAFGGLAHHQMVVDSVLDNNWHRWDWLLPCMAMRDWQH